MTQQMKIYLSSLCTLCDFLFQKVKILSYVPQLLLLLLFLIQ